MRVLGSQCYSQGVPASDECLLISIPLSDRELGTPDDDDVVDEVESTVCSVLSEEFGRWDGHEFGASWATIFLYGRSADALFEGLALVLLTRQMRIGSVAVSGEAYLGDRTATAQLRSTRRVIGAFAISSAQRI